MAYVLNHRNGMTRWYSDCLLRPLQSCPDVLHRKLAGRFQVFQFLPIDGQSNGSPGTCSNSIVGDRRRGVIIPQIIDKDFSRAFGFAHRRDISLGCRGYHLVCYSGGKTFYCRPGILRLQENGDMEALSSGTFERRFQALSSQALTKVLRAEFQGLKGDFRCRVQIEDHAVRTINRVDRGTPGMKFDRAHLNHFQQPLFVLDIEVLIRLALVFEFKWAHISAQAFPWIPLKKTLLVDSRRATEQAERMPHNLRQYPGRDRCVIFGKFALRDMADVGDDALRMRNRDSVQHQLFRLLAFDCCRFAPGCHRHLLLDLRSVLVSSQTLERSVPTAALCLPISSRD